MDDEDADDGLLDLDSLDDDPHAAAEKLHAELAGLEAGRGTSPKGASVKPKANSGAGGLLGGDEDEDLDNPSPPVSPGFTSDDSPSDIKYGDLAHSGS